MKKRFKIVACVLSLCLSIGLLVFGVFATIDTTATLQGTIEYQVENAFVQIQTKVYKSKKYLHSGQIGEYLDELTEGDFNTTPTGLSLHSTSPVYISDPNQTNNYLYDDLDLSFNDSGDTALTYFFVVNIVNLSDEINVWAIMDDSAFDYVATDYDDEFDDAQTAAKEIQNTIQVNNGAQPIIDENGKNMVMVLGVDDYSQKIESKAFNYQINIGVGDLDEQQFVLDKLTPLPSLAQNSVSPYSTEPVSVGAIDDTIKGVVVIPDGVTEISEEGFYSKQMITTVILPESCTTFQPNAFGYSCSITTLNIPSTVTTISDYSFGYLLNLILLKYNAVSVGEEYIDYAFCNFGGETNGGMVFKIGEGVTTLAESLFYGDETNNNIYSLEIPSTLNFIGDNAFTGCALNLQKLTVHPDNPYFTDGSLNGGQNCLIDKREDKRTLILGSCNSIIPQDEDLVTTIGHGAFCESNLQSITIPNNITTVESQAFAYCYNLTNLTIGDGVQTLGESAFQSCNHIQNLSIGKNLQTLEDGALSNISSDLAYITVHPENPYYSDGTEKGGQNCLIEEENFTLLLGCINSVIPQDDTLVTTIGNNAFQHSKIQNLVIPQNISTIQNYAFSNCSSLTRLTIGSGVQTIGNNAFDNCTALESLIIPNNVQTIGNSAFSYCRALESLTIGSGIQTLGNNAFDHCTALESLTIGSGVQTIGNYAFYNCTALTEINYNATNANDLADGNRVFYKVGQSGEGINVTIGDNVTSIPARLFYPANYSDVYPNLTTLTIGNGVKTIGTYAFFSCKNLTSLTIGSGVKTIGNDAFSNCQNITQINYNATSVTDLTSANFVFAWAGQSGEGINVTIGDNVEYIPERLFRPASGNSYTPNLTTLTIGSGVKTIGNYAFYECLNITEINYNATNANDLASDNYVFYNAGQSGEGINVTIGDNVTAIPAYLFYPYYGSSTAPKITSLTIGSGVETIGNYAFAYCSSIPNLTLPNSVQSIGMRAFSNCTDLTTLTIGSGLKTIGDFAFYHCNSLSSITIDDDNTNYDDYNSSCIIDKNPESETYKHLIQGCSSTVIPENDFVTTIKTNAFSYTGIQSITIPDIITEIEEAAFDSCLSLNSLTIGSGVQTIEGGAFGYCNALEEINYNATNVTNFEEWNYIFTGAGCESDGITLTIGANVQSIPAYFTSTDETMPNIKTIVFEQGSVCTGIGDYAFLDCTSITSIVLPASIQAINNGAFNGCTGLTNVYYYGTEVQKGSINFNANNTPLTNATWYYYNTNTSETIAGKYWYYDANNEIKTFEVELN